MSYRDRLTFVKEESRYNPVTGKHELVEMNKDVQPCLLSVLSTERTNTLFGNIDQRIIVARLQRPYTKACDYVLIDNKKYHIKRQSNYRKGVFYLEGGAHG
ncbi:hypothetical protein NSQ26_06050 [Bacillus sp. FSL W7-1360]